MRKFHSGIRRICAAIIGIVFFISGLLKMMDPLGTGLIVESYYKFLSFGFAEGSGTVVGAILSLAETIIGMALISGVWRKLLAIVTLVFLGGFTLLTLALLVVNPDMDCGCFGQAVHLSHLESFLKNIVLLILAAVAFIPLADGFGPRKPKYVGFALSLLAVLFFMWYSHARLPLVDFTAFTAGNEIFPSWNPDGAVPQSEVPALLPLQDVSGEYVDYLAGEGQVLAISVYEPEKMEENDWQRISECVNGAYSSGVRPMVITTDPDLASFTVGECLYKSDRKTLMTFNRSNGGAVFLDNGLIVSKWALGNLPDAEELSETSAGESQENAMYFSAYGRISFGGLLIGSLALLVLL